MIFSECRSNLTVNIVSWAKKTRNEWWTMPKLAKENVLCDSKPSLGQFFIDEEAKGGTAWLKPRELQRKYLTIHSWETENFVEYVRVSFFFPICSNLVQVAVFLWKTQTFKIWKAWYSHTFFQILINLVSKQLNWIQIFKLAKYTTGISSTTSV